MEEPYKPNEVRKWLQAMAQADKDMLHEMMRLVKAGIIICEDDCETGPNTLAIDALVEFFPAIVQTEQQTSIGINGYGARSQFTVKIIVLDSVCQKCGETASTYVYEPMPYRAGTCEHIWKDHVQYEICTSSALDPDDAWRSANSSVSGYLRRVQRVDKKFTAKLDDFFLRRRRPQASQAT